MNRSGEVGSRNRPPWLPRGLYIFAILMLLSRTVRVPGDGERGGSGILEIERVIHGHGGTYSYRPSAGGGGGTEGVPSCVVVL